MSIKAAKMRGRTVQNGFSIVEVLVTLVIVTVALLSAASLQALSKRSNYDALQRTTAAHLAESVLERIRANPGATGSYLTGIVLGNGALGAAPPVNCLDPGITCTAAEMAAFDLWQFEQELDGAAEQDAGRATGGLSFPAACIQGPAGGGTGEYTVAIAWRGMTGTANPATTDCGESSGHYGADDAYRRAIFVRTFINNV